MYEGPGRGLGHLSNGSGNDVEVSAQRGGEESGSYDGEGQPLYIGAYYAEALGGVGLEVSGSDGDECKPRYDTGCADASIGYAEVLELRELEESGLDNSECQPRYRTSYTEVPGETANDAFGDVVDNQSHHSGTVYSEAPGEFVYNGFGEVVDDGPYYDDGYDACPDEYEGDDGDDGYDF